MIHRSPTSWRPRSLVAFLVFTASSLPALARSPAPESDLLFADHHFDLQGRVLDTRKGLGMHPDTHTIAIQWKGLTLQVEQLLPAADNPATRFATELERGILAMRGKLEVELPEELPPTLATTLDAHRRVGGLGVHGPLAFAGRLEARYAWQGWHHAIVYRLTVDRLVGPRGSYQGP